MLGCDDGGGAQLLAVTRMDSRKVVGISHPQPGRRNVPAVLQCSSPRNASGLALSPAGSLLPSCSLCAAEVISSREKDKGVYPPSLLGFVSLEPGTPVGSVLSA